MSVCIDETVAAGVWAQDGHEALRPEGCSRKWAVAQTYPQAEQWAARNLEQRGYTTFLPMFARAVADRVTPSMQRVVLRPLFTGYVFVAIDGQWTPIRYSPGVQKLLMSAGKPNIVASGVLSALQADEAVRRTPTPRDAPHRPGAACVARHGPCQGMEGVVVSVSGTKAVIAVMMFGGLVRATVALDALEAR